MAKYIFGGNNMFKVEGTLEALGNTLVTLAEVTLADGKKAKCFVTVTPQASLVSVEPNGLKKDGTPKTFKGQIGGTNGLKEHSSGYNVNVTVLKNDNYTGGKDPLAMFQ
jgi:hypothetical protein